MAICDKIQQKKKHLGTGPKQNRSQKNISEME